ncbi:MAG: hypothetical protein EOO68_13425, partial [Moraxellaceae bacterium]
LPVIASYQEMQPVEKTAFFESGILVNSPLLAEIASGPSSEITIPMWRAIDASVEPNYSNDVYADIATPRNLGTTQLKARVAYLNEAFAQMDLVVEVTGQNPLQAIATKLDTYWTMQAQRRTIASVIGVYNANVAQNAGDMVVNVSVTTGTPTALNKFSAESLIDAEATMGDNLAAFGAIAVHRNVYTGMQKSNLIQFVPASDQKTMIPTYQGLRVVVDNGLPVFGTGITRQYVSIIFGQGAIGYGDALPHNALRFQSEEERGNGGGAETLWTRRNMLVHPTGYNFTSTTITGNGTETTPRSAGWSDLTLAANWARVHDRNNVPLAFLVTNA